MASTDTIGINKNKKVFKQIALTSLTIHLLLSLNDKSAVRKGPKAGKIGSLNGFTPYQSAYS